jgi:hypothetical protein
LAGCNVSGCGMAAQAVPTVPNTFDLLLATRQFERRACPECPPNERLSPTEVAAMWGQTPPPCPN